MSISKLNAISGSVGSLNSTYINGTGIKRNDVEKLFAKCIKPSGSDTVEISKNAVTPPSKVEYNALAQKPNPTFLGLTGRLEA